MLLVAAVGGVVLGSHAHASERELRNAPEGPEESPAPEEALART